jgi:cytochrome c oxidase subunit 2
MIVNPNNKIVQGFQPVMPSFQGILKDRDVDDLVRFIETQSDKFVPEPTTKATQAATGPATQPMTK